MTVGYLQHTQKSFLSYECRSALPVSELRKVNQAKGWTELSFIAKRRLAHLVTDG